LSRPGDAGNLRNSGRPIEKEGFDPLIEAAEMRERFDIAVMSTKGMSTTAARHLLDRLADRVDKVLVLHDFDIAGFSIFGTLGSDGRRYQFENNVPVYDLGLRLADINAMDLQSEPIEEKQDWDRRAETLERHGASRAEIEFLRTRRVELNAMTSDQFIEFLETRLTEHGIKKVIPDAETAAAHARRMMEQVLAERFLAEHKDRIATQAAEMVMPDDLLERVEELLEERTQLSWDQAIQIILEGNS
jgi:hypothetical protein